MEKFDAPGVNASINVPEEGRGAKYFAGGQDPKLKTMVFTTC